MKITEDLVPKKERWVIFVNRAGRPPNSTSAALLRAFRVARHVALRALPSGPAPTPAPRVVYCDMVTL